jgi:hypothetical protein
MPNMAKPSQAKVITEGVDLREVQVDVPLSAIPVFDHINGLCNRHLTITGGYANANDFKSG